MDSGRTGQDLLRQNRRRVDDVFTAIQNDQHLLGPQELDQMGDCVVAMNRKAERSAQRARHELRIIDRSQIHKPDAIFVRWNERLGHCQGHRRLADSSGSNNCDKTRFRQLVEKRANHVSAAHGARLREREIVGPIHDLLGLVGGPFGLGETDRSHEAIAATGNVGQIPSTRLAIAQCPPKRVDVNPEAALVDERVGPDAGHKFALADQFARALDQRGQNLESAAAEANGGFTFQQKLSRRKEAERTE